MTEMQRIGTSVTINAPIGKVWQALTTPSMIKQWFFGVDTESDWEIGSSIVHRASGRASPTKTRATSSSLTRPT